MSDRPNKVALITGGSRGIGAAIAERLARDGFTVVINYARRGDAAEALLEKIRESGGQGMALQADVADPAAFARLFDTVEAEYGGLDVLVNNAGMIHYANLVDFDDATFDRLMAVNLKGTFNGMREAARRLRDGGRIVNLSTSVLGMKLPTYSVYAASKAAVEAMTSVLSKELRGRNITVNAVSPGPTATDLFLEGKSQEVVDRLAMMSPLERLGAPEDIARVVSFLAGPEGGWINGQVVRANGGIV
ncbi:3-ketoacyl-ACP reductase [Halothiobacillus diazotrophicus]|uniref:3-ketoacyl-ACP reductase n=1 Tax=Halothiobacillus diazotrophicus TaxID=1860122 RepID=A0A191ZEB2_9GAMM|nr:SDR family oxidoreductase [Halothiobacillus diazotrophicus]ANJ66208.1 3-ketoacyl-ACP reductase [Halothiobacillus diazotrophicus]